MPLPVGHYGLAWHDAYRTRRTTYGGRFCDFSARAGLVSAAFTAVLALPGVGSADRVTATVYVSHAGVTGAADRDCATAAYQNVQHAVNAAPDGATVYLCGRTPFRGPVVIEKDLRLTGDRGAALVSEDDPANPTADQLPARYWPSQWSDLERPTMVLAVLGSVSVRVKGLTLSGPFVNESCPPAFPDDFGIVALGPTGGSERASQRRHDNQRRVGHPAQLQHFRLRVIGWSVPLPNHDGRLGDR